MATLVRHVRAALATRPTWVAAHGPVCQLSTHRHLSKEAGRGKGPADEGHEEASFGFMRVPKDLKEGEVQVAWHSERKKLSVTVQHPSGLVGEVFKRVAPQYDKMNDAMSFGVHRFWKRWV